MVSIAVATATWLILRCVEYSEGRILRELRKSHSSVVGTPDFTVIYVGNNLFLASEITKEFCLFGYKAYYNKSSVVVWTDGEDIREFSENVAAVLDHFSERIAHEDTYYR